MEVVILPTYEEMSRAAAEIVADVLNTKPDAVLGMATGSTPLGLYQELVRMHREAGLDFTQVTTFNLDDSYRRVVSKLPRKHRPEGWDAR